MVVGAISSRTELAVIGAGPGGYVAALRAADAGLDVTVIERDRVGGVCLNVGCIPSKTLIEIAGLRHAALNAEALGLDARVDLDLGRLNDRLGAVSTQLRRGVSSLLESAGVTVITGNANFARYDRLSIEHGNSVSHLEFDNVIVATGARPIVLPELPVGGRVVDSTGALMLDEVPKTMVIVGGGYIGVELGTAWAKLGVAVTIVEATQTILGSMPTMLADVVMRRLGQLGVDVVLGDSVAAVTERGLRLASGTELAVDIVVSAVGRRPNSDRCALDTVGVNLDGSGHVVVDPQMRAATGIYAIGDLVGGLALAHKASAEAEVAVAAILGRPSAGLGAVPAVVFSDPEIMSVGATPEQAANAGLNVHRFPHAASARAQTIGATAGLTVIVTDEFQTVVGVHAIGPHVSELAGEATLAIEMAATLEDVSLTVHPHPTMSETVTEAAWLALGSPLHIRR